jgi:hypothetical protein
MNLDFFELALVDLDQVTELSFCIIDPIKKTNDGNPLVYGTVVLENDEDSFINLQSIALDHRYRGNGKYLFELAYFYGCYKLNNHNLYIYCEDCNSNSNRIFEYYYKNINNKSIVRSHEVYRNRFDAYMINVPSGNTSRYEKMVNNGIDLSLSDRVKSALDDKSSAIFSRLYAEAGKK